MIRSDPLTTPFPAIRVDREVLLWAGLTGCAALLRFHDLGARPLDPDEARVALEAYRAVGFGRPWASPESAMPGYTGLMSVLFFLFGSSDEAARLLSAIAGSGIVALCWLARPLLGNRGAMGVAGLLASSPVLIESSRSALGASPLTLLVFAEVLTLARTLREVSRGESASSPWLFAIGAITAAGLATGSMFALQLLVVGAALIFAFDLGALHAGLARVRSVPPGPFLLGFVATVVIFTTRLGTNPGGLQAGVVDALWGWSTELLQPARLPIAPLALILGTECLILATTIGAAFRIGRASALERFAAAWFAIAFATAIIAGRLDYRLIAPAILAAAVLGGPWLARVVSDRGWHQPMTYGVAGIAAVPLVAALIATLPTLRNSSGPTLQVVAAGLAGFAGAVVGAYALVGRRAAVHGLVLLGLAVAFVGSVVGAARLSAASASDLGRIGPGTVLTAELREVEWQMAIWEWDQDRRPILVDDRLRETLGWMLRSSRGVRWTPPADIVAGPAVKLASARGDALPERGLRVTIGYQFTGLADVSPARIAEWLLWRRSVPRVEPYDILVLR